MIIVIKNIIIINVIDENSRLLTHREHGLKQILGPEITSHNFMFSIINLREFPIPELIVFFYSLLTANG